MNHSIERRLLHYTELIMWYLIDGHNLIPKLGLRLDDPEDEMALVRLLQIVASRKRARIDVYFDGAPPGHAGSRKIGA